MIFAKMYIVCTVLGVNEGVVSVSSTAPMIMILYVEVTAAPTGMTVRCEEEHVRRQFIFPQSSMESVIALFQLEKIMLSVCQP